MLKATKVYCYEQGCKSMLSIGGDDLAKSTIFRYWWGCFSKIDTSADVQFFAQNEVKTKKKVITFPDAQFFAQNEVTTKKKVIMFADAQFRDMKILGGYIPPWICTHGDEEVRNYRKTLFIQSIVENGWLGGCIPHIPPSPGSAPGSFLILINQY